MIEWHASCSIQGMRARRGGWIAIVVSCCCLAGTARADEIAAPPRLMVAPTFSGIVIHRAASSSAPVVWGYAPGVQARIHFGMHGVAASYTFVGEGMTVFGPEVHLVDVAYSLAAIPARRKNDASLTLDFGPALGFVSHTLAPINLFEPRWVDEPAHVTIGGKAAVAVAMRLDHLYFGLELAYRGGVPTGAWHSRWEGAFSATIALGVDARLR